MHVRVFDLSSKGGTASTNLKTSVGRVCLELKPAAPRTQNGTALIIINNCKCSFYLPLHIFLKGRNSVKAYFT